MQTNKIKILTRRRNHLARRIEASSGPTSYDEAELHALNWVIDRVKKLEDMIELKEKQKLGGG